jgi:signal transduction histidine kinase
MVNQSIAVFRARVRAWPARAVDAAIAAALLIEVGLEAGFVDVAVADWLAYVALGALAGLGILIRRDHPVVALALAIVAACLLNLLPRELQDVSEGLFFGLLFLVYSMALRCSGATLRRAILMTAGGVVLAIATSPEPQTGDYFFALILVIAAPVAAGQLLQSRAHLNEALREKAARIDRERTERAEEAVAEERARIAGELHDVVAHALGAMTVQAAAARRLADRDAERAGTAFEAVEATGREALTELRRLLAVLRREDEEAELEPQPKLEFVADLVARTQEAGLPVELSVEGVPDLPPGVDLTAYRVVQDALNDALRNGGAGHAAVHVRYTPEGVEIEIVDDGQGAFGRQLLGTHERVRLYGGQLEVGPRREGGHVVLAQLPREAPA